MSAILLIGEDAFLLETRAAVLRTTGAEILSCDTSSALPTMGKQFFDIVIFCHSIPLHLCHTLAEIIHQNWPGTRLLRVAAVRHWEESEEVVGVDLCSAQPERLIEQTIALLGRRKPAVVKPALRETSVRISTVH